MTNLILNAKDSIVSSFTTLILFSKVVDISDSSELQECNIF